MCKQCRLAYHGYHQLALMLCLYNALYSRRARFLDMSQVRSMCVFGGSESKSYPCSYSRIVARPFIPYPTHETLSRIYISRCLSAAAFTPIGWLLVPRAFPPCIPASAKPRADVVDSCNFQRKRTRINKRSRPTPTNTMRTLFTLFSALLAYTTVVYATALTYRLEAHEQACFFAQVDNKGTKLAFYFAVRSLSAQA
jgi:hypothetical protein